MALSIDEANAVSSKYYDKTITQQAYEKCPLYVHLKSKGNVVTDGGTQIQWPIRQEELNKARFTGPREQVAYGQKETRTGAVLDWKYLIAHAMISWDERVKNSGKPKVISLMEDKATEMREDALDVFATAIWQTTPGADDPSSLPEIVDTGTTYAGIAVADAALWAAGAEDTAETEMKLYGTNSISESCNAATFGPDSPDFAITSRDLWSKFESLIEPQRRYYGKESGLGKAGFTTIAFHDMEIVSDVYAPAGSFYALDSGKYFICYHPDYNFKTEPWEKLKQAGYPYAMVKTTAWVGNLKCRMRRTSYKYTALDYEI